MGELEPVRREGVYVYVSAPAAVPGAEATVVEDEGVTSVIRREDADDAGLTYDYVAAWITLRIHSALDAVGLTAAVSATLAEAGISCNVLAGRFHDHLLVPLDRSDEALSVLRALEWTHRTG